MVRDYSHLHDPNAGYTMRDLSAEAMNLDASRGGYRSVEITDVQTVMVDGNFPWTLVRVYTDMGVSGTGEAYWGAGIPELIDRMKPFLLGENPLDVDRLFQHLIQRMSGEGSIAGKTVTAISGIEIALHDAAGKLLDVPVYQLLGGKYRDTIRVYCDCHAGRRPEPEATANEAERVVEELGYDALKFDLDVPSGHDRDHANRHIRPAEIDHKSAIVEAVVDRVGDRAEVAFDCHWSYTADSALRLARALEPFNIWWLEDPVPPENHDVQRNVTMNTTTPVAAGENVYRRHGHRTLIEGQGVDVLTPDPPKAGGLRETRKIGELADGYYVPIALHNVSSPIGTMACAHLAAAIPNVLAVEFHGYELPWWGDIVQGSVINDGTIAVPDAPGLGVTLENDVVEDHLIKGESLFDRAR